MSFRSRFRKLVSFLDKRVFYLLLSCLVLSFAIYVSETAFAYSILLFLTKLGFTKEALPEGFRFFDEFGGEFAVGLLIATALFRGLNWWFLQYSIGAVLETFRYVQRRRITKALMDGRLKNTGESLALYGEKTNEASAMVVSAQTTFVHGVLSVSYFLTLCYLSLTATLIATAALVFVLGPISFLYKVVRSSGDSIRSEWTRINKQLMLAFDNIFFLNISGMIPDTKSSAEKSLSVYLSHFLKYHKIAAIVLVTPQIAGIIILVVVAHYSSQFQFLDKALLVPYFYLFLRFIQAGAQASSRLSEVYFKWPQTKELFNWWDENENQKSSTEAEEESTKISLDRPIGFSITNLCFGYKEGELVFDNFGFEIPPGKTVVITGRSGSGKSTFMNLLLGMKTPQSGEVNLVLEDGSKEFSTHQVRHSLWEAIGHVGADSYMIAGTIRENLTFGNRYAPDEEEIRSCLFKADCGWVYDLEGGLEYFVGESGAGLSTGQRQRLGLARALLRRPKAMILDEFTANLDLESQNHLIESLRQLKGKVTIVIVSHRPELLKLADIHLSLESKILPLKVGGAL